jgi:hypothetical protein
MSELSGSEEIGGTDDMGGFTLPPIGSIAKGNGVLMCFTGEITVCGEDDSGLLFELEYADDPSAKAKIYCKTTAQAGLSKIVGIGRDSGVFDKIDKYRISNNKKPIQSSEGKVKAKTLMDPKFMNQMRKEIVGCSVLCTITHSPAKPYEDKETGEMKDGFPQANISKIAPAKANAASGKPNVESPSNPSNVDEDDFS